MKLGGLETARAVVSIVQRLVPVEALSLGSRSGMFQQDTENQSVRYQQKWNDCCGNEKGGAELTRQQSGCIGHIERIQQIETPPDVKDPRERNSQLTP